MEVTSTWPEENIKIQDVLRESNHFPAEDLVDLLEEDHCVSLARPIDGEKPASTECMVTVLSPNIPPTLKMLSNIKPMSLKVINGLMILSEARILETYVGNHEEYWKTVHGELMGDFGDSKIYKCEINFEKPQTKVTLKLKASCAADSVWVYAFHIVTAIQPVSCADFDFVSPHSFSSEHLKSVLKDKEVQMSKQAMQFHQMLNQFNSSNGLNQRKSATDPMSFMALMMGTVNPNLGGNICGKRMGNGDISNGDDNTATGNGDKLNSDSEKTMEMMQNQLKQNNESEVDDRCTKIKNELKKLSIESNIMKFRDGDCRNSDRKDQLRLNIDSFVDRLQSVMQNNTHTSDVNKLELLHMAMNNSTSKSLTNSVGLKDLVLTEQDTIENLSDQQTPLDVINANVSPLINSSNDVVSRVTVPMPSHSKNTKCPHYDLMPSEPRNDVTVKFNSDRESHVQLQYSEEMLLKSIEGIVDKKLAALEERVLQKLEQKLNEKNENDCRKFKRLEEIILQISEKL